MIEKTLLIHTEQGVGDAIQFARYLPLAAARCAKLIVVCPQDLQPVFAAVSGIGQLRPPGQIEMTEFDVHLPIASLPHVFGTTQQTIPDTVPYIDGDLIRRRGDAAEGLTLSPAACFRVGVVWAGGSTLKDERAYSCHVREFLPLLGTPDIEIYCLQTGKKRAQLDELPAGIEVHDPTSALRHFGDTAMLIQQLDLVIGVDTPEVHLAGALGKTVWTLLSRSPDWRWGLQGEATPWYPCMRLFRQHELGDWCGVISRVAEALTQARSV